LGKIGAPANLRAHVLWATISLFSVLFSNVQTDSRNSMIVLITGATAGFGAEMARKFVQHGHKVIAAGRRRERLDALAAELGATLLPVELDVTSKDSINAALAALPAEWKEIDVLVNNAGLAWAWSRRTTHRSMNGKP